MEVVVIGSLSTDFLVQSDRLPTKGETILGTDFKTAFGGKGANQAIAAGRLGSSVTFIGAIGDDIFGKDLKKNLESNHILSDRLETIEGVSSGTAHITIYEGDNSIIFVPGTNGHVTPSLVESRKDVILGAKYVVIQNEIPVETTKYIIDFCYENNVKLIYNPAPFVDIGMNYLDKCDIVTPNEIECQQLFGEHWEQVIPRYPNKLIVTLGEEGAVYHDGKEVVHIPAISIEPVDTTGAGDTFNGALTSFLEQGYSLKVAVESSNIASALAIQKIGAQTGMPTIEEWEESVKEWRK